MANEEKKLKFFGLIKAAAAIENKELDYDALAQMFEEPKSKLRSWFKQFKEQAKDDDILKLIDLDTIVLDKVIEKAEEDLTEQFKVNPITGVIEPVVEEPKVTAKVRQFRDRVTGLKLLDEELRATAGSLVCQIAEATQDELNPRDLANLANALVSIQNAFFNKPTTNIQVNNIQATETEGGTTLLNVFKERLKN